MSGTGRVGGEISGNSTVMSGSVYALRASLRVGVQRQHVLQSKRAIEPHGSHSVPLRMANSNSPSLYAGVGHEAAQPTGRRRGTKNNRNGVSWQGRSEREEGNKRGGVESVRNDGDDPTLVSRCPRCGAWASHAHAGDTRRRDNRNRMLPRDPRAYGAGSVAEPAENDGAARP
jgi:hypothetical protein